MQRGEQGKQRSGRWGAGREGRKVGAQRENRWVRVGALQVQACVLSVQNLAPALASGDGAHAT